MKRLNFQLRAGRRRMAAFAGVGAALVALAGLFAVLGSPVESASAGATSTTVKCANKSSDSRAINNAIVSSTPGTKIVFAGTCLVTSTIRLRGDRAYSGESRSGTVLRQADGANLTAVLASDSYVDDASWTGRPYSLRDLTIDANKEGNSGSSTHGLVVRSWLTTVENIHVRGAAGSGILVTNRSRNGTALTNSQVNGRIAGNFVDSSNGSGIWVQDSGNGVTDWQLVDNWVADSGENGILLENAAGWYIDGNHVYGVQKDAIYAQRMFATSISNNYIEDFGNTPTAGTRYGIHARLQGDAASTIADNRVFNFGGDDSASSTYRYIGIAQVMYGTAQASVTGNAIRGSNAAGDVGLYYSKGTADGLVVASTGNSVTDVSVDRSVGSGVTLGAGL